MDQLYYALLDLTKNNIRPPLLILNALLLGAGQIGSLDRAFALIQEYETEFHVKPTLETYVALIDAVSHANPPAVPVLLAVLQVKHLVI